MRTYGDPGFYGWEHPNYYAQPKNMSEDEIEEAINECEYMNYQSWLDDQEESYE
jgi:hypothetical protein